jgi:signal transduction histidine kinase
VRDLGIERRLERVHLAFLGVRRDARLGSLGRRLLAHLLERGRDRHLEAHLARRELAREQRDLELAALISSKICHDVIGPVGAIYNGLEILDEDSNLEAKTYAMDVIRNVTEQASAKLQFARFAFGAATCR